MSSDLTLNERRTITVSDKGRMRIPRDYWRAMGSPVGDVTADLVENEDGEMEVRLRV